MLILGKKALFLICLVVTTGLFAAKPSIDGGVMYPIVDGKTGPYHVNLEAHSGKIKFGRTPTKDEYDAWNVDVMPDGTGLPEGSGSVEMGEEIYDAKCIMCHGDFGSGGGGYPALSKGSGEELHSTLKYQRLSPDMDGPVRVFGTFWPQTSTLWWYIKDAMPHQLTSSLSDDEVYALVAYILNINEFEIDGVEVDEEYVLDREKFLKIKLPNVDGFEPNIDGPKGPENVREYFKNPSNFGGIKVKESQRCMSDCQEETAQVVYIQGAGISDFHPPLSAKRSLLAEKEDEGSFDAKKAYSDHCAMCHESGAAPALGDKGAWAVFIAQGTETLNKKGIEGTDAGMPPMGGSPLTKDQFRNVVDYIVDQSK